MDFVRKSVRAIGRCAIKVESAAERCVGTLVELIQTKVTYVVQEAVIVIKVSVNVCVCVGGGGGGGGVCVCVCVRACACVRGYGWA